MEDRPRCLPGATAADSFRRSNVGMDHAHRLLVPPLPCCFGSGLSWCTHMAWRVRSVSARDILFFRFETTCGRGVQAKARDVERRNHGCRLCAQRWMVAVTDCPQCVSGARHSRKRCDAHTASMSVCMRQPFLYQAEHQRAVYRLCEFSKKFTPISVCYRDRCPH